MFDVCIIKSDFYSEISSKLLEGAEEVLKKEGLSYEVITVPGALEMASALSWYLDLFITRGVIVLGAVIKGETSHYDIVCEESARSIYNVALEYGIPLANGILTTENEAQALERADKNKKNKGGSAASTVVSMMKLQEELINRSAELEDQEESN